MMTTQVIPRSPRSRLLLGATLLAVELLAIGTIFKHVIDFTCLDNWPERACTGASTALVSVYCMISALALFSLFFPRALTELVARAGTHLWPLGVNLAGVLVALAPVLFLTEGAGSRTVLPAFLIWSAGALLLLGGLGLFLAPADRWRVFLRAHGTTLVPMLLASAAAPHLARMLRPIWRIDTISDMTFTAVASLVRGLGYAVETEVGRKVIGDESFAINVAPACSGVEGFALVTIFVTIYLALMRADLRFPRAFILYPVGLLASATFNVVRIAVLLIIGLEGNPALAVGGFHSHAGWLMFTLVALGIIALAQTVPWLRKAPAASAGGTGAAAPAASTPPFLQDPVVARILPFAVFMFSALLAQVFTQTPGVVYPLRVLAMGAVLALFWRLYRALPWQIDTAALAVGGAIGLMWVAVPVAPGDAAPPYGALSGALLVAWYVLRGLGTVVFVPVIEELFFRGYLEARLRLGSGRGWAWLAAVLTAALFAALHDRWAEAFLAGLAFSWVLNRRGRVTDAILAHATANAIVYAVAVGTGRIHII